MASQHQRTEQPCLTTGQVVLDYVAWLERHRPSNTAREARYAAEAHILPELASLPVAKLTAARLRRWHEALAEAPKRLRVSRGSTVPRFQPSSADPEARRARRATANRVLTILKAALNRAYQDGRVGSDAPWKRPRPCRSAPGSAEGEGLLLRAGPLTPGEYRDGREYDCARECCTQEQHAAPLGGSLRVARSLHERDDIRLVVRKPRVASEHVLGPDQRTVQPVEPLALLVPAPHDAVRQPELPQVTPRRRPTPAPFPVSDQKLGGRAKASWFSVRRALTNSPPIAGPAGALVRPRAWG